MARDYKNSNRARSKAKPRSKSKARSKQGTPAPIWFLAGLSLGLGAALVVHAYHVQLAPRLAAIPTSTEPAPAAKAPSTDKRPRFEFYKILPEMEVVVPEEEERALATKPQPPSPPSPSKPSADSDRYLLQVASFQKHAEADRLKAELALIGLQASIQTVEIRGGQTWHRVRVGPFSDQDQITSVRQRLQANGIEAVLLKLGG